MTEGPEYFFEQEHYTEAPREALPKKRKKAPFVVLLLAVLLVAAGAFYVFEWNDFRYVLGPSQEEQAADARLAEELAGFYGYDQLSADEQAKYRLFMRAYETGKPQPYPVNDVGDLDCIGLYVLADQPLMPDVGEPRIRPGGIFTPAYVEFRYYDGEEERAQRLARIDEAAQACLADLPADADDYATSKYVYEWLANHTDYDDTVFSGPKHTISMSADSLPRDYGQTAGDVFLDGKAVCAGYTRAFQYAMQQRGIQCAYITGYVNDGDIDEYHAWCVVRLDGEYYFVDPTWGDPAYFDGDEAEDHYYTVNYDYLNVTTSFISRTHTPDEDLPLPECTSMADNYYVRENLYFETADRSRLGSLFAATQPGTLNTVFVLCANHEVYADLYAFMESGGLLDYANVDYHYFDVEEDLILGFYRDYE